MANEWHYSKNGKRFGPVSVQRLKELAARGEIGPADLVWKEGMPQWVPASKIKGLLPGSAAVTNKPSTSTSPAAPAKFSPSAKQPTKKAETQRDDSELPKPKAGLSTNAKVLAVGGVALVGILVIGTILAISGWMLFGGKSNSSPQAKADGADFKKSQSQDNKTKQGEQPKGKMPPDTTANLPDFAKVDYTVPFAEKDYDYDFSKVDYSKGPKGQPLEQRAVFELHNKQTVPQRPRNPGQINFRIVSTGFVNSEGKFIKHGIESVYTNKERAILASEELPPNPKFADQNRWKFDSDEDQADGFISVKFAEKIMERYYYDGEPHGPIKMWLPVQELRLQELQLPIAKTTRNQRLPGDVSFEGFFVNGKAHGKNTLWAKGPQDPKNYFKQPTYKQSEKWNIKGVLHGPDRRWHDDGSKAWEGWWKNGKMHGKWEWWGKVNVALKLPNNFEVAGPHGEYHFVNGIPHGLESRWYSDGKLLSQGAWVNGTLQGPFTEWWPNGIKKTLAVFENGKIVQHEQWDEKGRPIPPPSRADMMLKRLVVGMSKQDVINFLGQPDARSPLGQGEAWLYFASETEAVFITFDTQGALRTADKQPRKK
jgi:antitoxin component YwqK of YwqJK toxin-antitoxin module